MKLINNNASYRPKLSRIKIIVIAAMVIVMGSLVTYAQFQQHETKANNSSSNDTALPIGQVKNPTISAGSEASEVSTNNSQDTPTSSGSSGTTQSRKPATYTPPADLCNHQAAAAARARADTALTATGPASESEHQANLDAYHSGQISYTEWQYNENVILNKWKEERAHILRVMNNEILEAGCPI